MQRVSAAEFVRHFSEISDKAFIEPLIITRNQRDRLVLGSVEHYRHLLSLALMAAPSGDEAGRLSELLQRASDRQDRKLGRR